MSSPQPPQPVKRPQIGTPKTSTPATPQPTSQTPTSAQAPVATGKPAATPSAVTANLFHFAECTNCRHLLPLATTTEKYFTVLSKDPYRPTGLGEKCMRCGADSWIITRD